MIYITSKTLKTLSNTDLLNKLESGKYIIKYGCFTPDKELNIKKI